MNDNPASWSRDIGLAGEALATALKELAFRIDEIASEADRQRGRLLALEELVMQLAERPRTAGEYGATALEELLGQLVREHQDHEAWLRNLSQHRTGERLTSGDHIVHHEIGSRYRDLIGQRLLDAAVMAGASTPAEEASARARLARVLFDPAVAGYGPDHGLAELREHGVEVTPELFRELQAAAAEIRSGATASGHPHRWVFDATPGAALDPSWQEPCDGCRATDPVLFVVAPGYQVEDKYYVRQLVFTEPAPASGADSAAAATAPVGPVDADEPAPAAPSAGEMLPAGEPQQASTARPPWWRRLLRRPSAAAK